MVQKGDGSGVDGSGVDGSFSCTKKGLPFIWMSTCSAVVVWGALQRLTPCPHPHTLPHFADVNAALVHTLGLIVAHTLHALQTTAEQRTIR